MTSIPPIEPTVAPSDFCPFTKEVAMPARVRDASTRVRPASTGGATTRPVRRNLLEMGLACGQGAAELEARAATADAMQREADREAGVDGDALAEEAVKGKAVEPPDPAAIAAMAGEIREIVRKRDQLAEELAGLDRERAELQAKLMALLDMAGVRPRPAAPEPASLSAGGGLPRNAYLPTHRWNRTD